MKRVTFVAPGLLGVLVLFAANCAEGPNDAATPTPESTGVAQERLYLDGPTWPDGIVPVCWESGGTNDVATGNALPNAATLKQNVRTYLEQSWGTAADIRFIGWDACPANPKHFLTFTWNSNQPRAVTYGLGDPGTGVRRIEISPFSLDLQYRAIHETGHGLGMAHEQQRPDNFDAKGNPIGCYPSDFNTPISGGTYLTPYDADSIMNYCANRNTLSAYDIAGIRVAYPPVLHRMSSVFSVARNHAEMYNVGSDGYLNFHYVNPGWWEDSSSFRSAPVKGDVSAVYCPWRNHSEVFFRDIFGLVQYYYVSNGAWAHDSGSFGVAVMPGGHLSAIFSPHYNHSELFAQGLDGLLHNYYVTNGSWSHGVPGTGVSTDQVTGEISAVYSESRAQSEVYWPGSDGTLRFSYHNGDSWVTDGGSFAAAGVVDHLSAVYSPYRNHSEVYVRGADNKLHFFFVQNGAWFHDGTSFLVAGDVGGDISAVWSPTRNHSEVYFRGADNNLHQFYVEKGAWVHNTSNFAAGGPVLRDVTSLFASQRGYSEVFYRGTNNLTTYFYNGPVPSMDNGSFQ